MKQNLFDVIKAERASGVITTLRSWLVRHPPPAAAFVQTPAGVARRVASGDSFFDAVREFIDEFDLRPRESRLAALSERPEPMGDARYDAYLGALAEHLAAVEGIDRPSWTIDAERFLDAFWFVSDVPAFRALAIAQSPAAFRRRGIFISAGSLQRV